MADFFIQATLSNFVVASILALIAWLVQRCVRSASLSNLLWALVLIKMITPPLVSIPMLEIPRIFNSSALRSESLSGQAPALGIVDSVSEFDFSERALVLNRDAANPSILAAQASRNVKVLLSIWLLVSGTLLVGSSFRIIRFHCLLMANSSVHEKLSQGLSIDVAKQLGLERYPSIVITQANIAPFVWWKGGHSVIVVSLQASQWRRSAFGHYS